MTLQTQSVSQTPALSPATRRDVLGAVARLLCNAALLVALYYLVPLDGRASLATLRWLALGLITFLVLVTLQLRSILWARHPALRAVEALGAALPLFVLVFASTYFQLATNRPGAFTEPLSKTDALYFTMSVLSTVGFGDIAPTTEAARLTVTAQMALNLVVLGLLARVVVGAVRVSRERNAPPPRSAEDVN